MSSKINLQTCEYARKSSIFQDNQLISDKKEWCSSQLDLTQIDLDALETDILVRLGITYDELSKMTEKKYHLLEKNA